MIGTISIAAPYARAAALRKIQPKWSVLMQSARDVVARLVDNRRGVFAEENFSLIARLRCDRDCAGEPAIPIRHLKVERKPRLGVRIRRLMHLASPLRDVPTSLGERVGRSWRHFVSNWGCHNSCGGLRGLAAAHRLVSGILIHSHGNFCSRSGLGLRLVGRHRRCHSFDRVPRWCLAPLISCSLW